MFYVSANLGAVVAAAAGGYLAEHHGWRTALFVAGAPGIFAALLLFFTVDEPRRGEMEEAEADGSTAPLAKARFRSEEHTSELQSLMRTSYAVFCLKKKKLRIPSA